jgi:hypothetical protein
MSDVSYTDVNGKCSQAFINDSPNPDCTHAN